jgi:hypothetical protein
MSGMSGGPSTIATARRDRQLQNEHLEALESLMETADRLIGIIGDENATAVVECAKRMLESGTVAFDG